MNMAEASNIRSWRRDSGREPAVRIGVVIEADAMPSIELRVPDDAYELLPEGTGAEMVRDVRITTRAAGDAVALVIGDGPSRVARSWSLAPGQPRPLCRGAGVLVRDVVAGRGFHWHKRVDQTLAGRLELFSRPGGLILVNEVPLETYLAGVITAEMSSRCPHEFLRAQCIVARSWLLAFTEPKHDAEPFDRCNDDCCQRYQGTGDLGENALDAVAVTRGQALLSPEGDVVDANYSKSCGGVVELPEHVWGIHKPGLATLVDAPGGSAAQRFRTVTDDNIAEYVEGDWLRQTDVYCSPRVVPEEDLGRYLGRVDESGRYFRWAVRYRREELEELLRRKLPEAADMALLRGLRVTRRGVSGRALEIALDVEGRSGVREEIRVPDQYRIRQVLHDRFLYSSAFAVRIDRDLGSADGASRTITLRGAGWGHGAGMCQIGALGMSLRGLDHGQILAHYFPQAVRKAVYSTS